MHSHRLILEGDSSKAAWRLVWDRRRLTLENPDGQVVLETRTDRAHRLVDLSQAFVDGTFSVVGPHEAWCFKQNRAALADLRDLVDRGLRCDSEYRVAMHQRAMRAIPSGAVMFLFAGGLFVAYCWYASWAPDPPANGWFRKLDWLIKGALAVLLAAALVGFGLTCSGLRQWLRIRSIERMAAADDEE